MNPINRRARRALGFSWAFFAAVLLLLVAASFAMRPSESARLRHREQAARYEQRQIAKGILAPSPEPRAAWRFAAGLEPLRQWDHATFHRINSGWSNPVSDHLMPVVTHLGDGAVQGLALLAYLGWAIYRRRTLWRHAALMAMVGLLVSGTTPLLKWLIPRFRPPSLYPYDIVLLMAPLYRGSFPSGHTFATFCIATILARFHPVITPWAFGLAILVGLSRIMVGVHWPLDVIGGAVLGIVAGYVVTAVWARRRGMPASLKSLSLDPSDEGVMATAA